jgi:Bacterial PH domain
MKIYKQSITSHYYFISFFFTMNSLIISLFNNGHFEVKLWSLLFLACILFLLIYVTLKSRYILEGDLLLICSGFYKNKIEIKRIEKISKRKIIFTNKYKLLIQPSRYNQIHLYPRQSDLENLLKDLKEINPNIIIN